MPSVYVQLDTDDPGHEFINNAMTDPKTECVADYVTHALNEGVYGPDGSWIDNAHIRGIVIING